MNQPTRSEGEHAANRGERDARVALANRLMTEHAPGTAGHERGLEDLQAVASSDDGAHARWLLGAYYLQVSSRPQAHVQALHWLELAAADGTPPAVDRLADLHLSGLGGGASARRALALQLRLANQGYQRAAWEAAYLLTATGPVDGLDAVTAFLRACALGYPPAYYSLGLRFATGNGVARDGALGHALLRRAADGGFAGASQAADAHAVPDSADWYERLRSNLHAVHHVLDALVPGPADGRSPPHPVVLQLERHLVSLGHPALRLDGAGRAEIATGRAVATASEQDWTWLSHQPRVATCRGFATPEECAHLINKVAAALRPAAAYRRGNSKNEDAELASFSGRGHPIGALHTDSVTRMLEHRVSRMTRWPIEKLEPCSIVCYRPGEEYKPHVDFFSDEQILLNEHTRRDFGGQRVATFLLYLKAPGSGGETSYLVPGLDIQGHDGLGVIHYNVVRDGAQDADSVHAGRPIIHGEKWLWRSTLRQHSLYEKTVGSGATSP